MNKIRIAQRRGSWVADVRGGSGAWEIVDRSDPRIAVIMDDEDGRFNYPKGHYKTQALPKPEGAWWFWPKHDEWRALLGSGRPFIIRKFAEVGRGRDAGPKIGVYRMKDMSMTADQFTFSFIPQRLAEVE